MTCQFCGSTDPTRDVAGARLCNECAKYAHAVSSPLKTDSLWPWVIGMLVILGLITMAILAAWR